jgi:hypothetical protein
MSGITKRQCSPAIAVPARHRVGLEEVPELHHEGHDQGLAGREPRVISDCHFIAPLDHVVRNFRTLSACGCLSKQISRIALRVNPPKAAVGRSRQRSPVTCATVKSGLSQRRKRRMLCMKICQPPPAPSTPSSTAAAEPTGWPKSSVAAPCGSGAASVSVSRRVYAAAHSAPSCCATSGSTCA